jgi:hypothetical protein
MAGSLFARGRGEGAAEAPLFSFFVGGFFGWPDVDGFAAAVAAYKFVVAIVVKLFLPSAVFLLSPSPLPPAASSSSSSVNGLPTPARFLFLLSGSEGACQAMKSGTQVQPAYLC